MNNIFDLFGVISIVLAVGLISTIVLGLLAVAKSVKTKGSSNIKKSQNLKFFKSDLDIKTSMRIVNEFAPSGGYLVDDIDEINNIIVLSNIPAYNNWGQIFPVYFSSIGNQTLIEIGVKAKVSPYVFRFILAEHQNKCFNGIRSAFYAESNKKFDNSGKIFCSNCGKPYSPNESIKFCPECGNRF